MLREILEWLTGVDGGAFLVVSIAFAWLLEDSQKWQALSGKIKWLIMLLVTAVLGAISAWLLTKPELVELIEPYARPTIYALLAWSANQGAHLINPKRKENVIVEIEKTVG